MNCDLGTIEEEELQIIEVGGEGFVNRELEVESIEASTSGYTNTSTQSRRDEIEADETKSSVEFLNLPNLIMDLTENEDVIKYIVAIESMGSPIDTSMMPVAMSNINETPEPDN